MIDYSKSYTARWRICRVNEATWQDGAELENFRQGSVSVTRDASGKAPKMEGGSFSATGAVERGYYRIRMVADQGGETAREDIATLLFEGASETLDFGTSDVTVEGESVLYPASVKRVVSGEYAAAGVDGAQYAARLLRRCVKAPVQVDGSFTLLGGIVHEFGATVLEAAWQVLSAGGFVMQVHGDGTVHVLPRPTEPKLVLDDAGASLLAPTVKRPLQERGVPNVYIAESELERAVAVNDDATSEVSTARRGYEHDELDTSPCPVNGETLERYARRRLQELSTLSQPYEYTREWVPGLYPFDLVKASPSALGTDGNLRIEAQGIACDHGALVTETANKEVVLWQA